MPSPAERSTSCRRSRLIAVLIGGTAVGLVGLAVLLRHGAVEATPWLVGLFTSLGVLFAVRGDGTCCWRKRRTRAGGSTPGRDDDLSRWPSP